MDYLSWELIKHQLISRLVYSLSFNSFANLLTVVSRPSLARLRFVTKDLANIRRQCVSASGYHCNKNMLHQTRQEKLAVWLAFSNKLEINHFVLLIRKEQPQKVTEKVLL